MDTSFSNLQLILMSHFLPKNFQSLHGCSLCGKIVLFTIGVIIATSTVVSIIFVIRKAVY